MLSARSVSIPLWFDSNQISVTALSLWIAFQFHSGSIQTERVRGCACRWWTFQFHSGSIQTTKELRDERSD